MFKKFIFIFLFLLRKNRLAEIVAKLRAIDRTTGRSFILETPLNQSKIFKAIN